MNIMVYSCLGIHLENYMIISFSYVIWRHGTRSTLVQVMTCCLTAPSHYLNQCWLIIIKVMWWSSKDNYTSNVQVINHQITCISEYYPSKFIPTIFMGLWVERFLCTLSAYWGSSHTSSVMDTQPSPWTRLKFHYSSNTEPSRLHFTMNMMNSSQFSS